MTILVTGGAGYIGSHFAHAMLDKGKNVVIIDDLSTGSKSAAEILEERLAVFIEGDICHKRALENAFKHDISAIVHFAGSVSVPESMRDPLKYFDNNFSKALALLREASLNNVRAFVFSSTAAVYGNSAKSPITEDDDTKPVSPYGESKLMMEMALSWNNRAGGLPYVALRYFNVAGADPQGRCGPKQGERPAHIIGAALHSAYTGTPLQVFGTDYDTSDGTGVRDFIHVSDLVEAHSKALDYLDGGGQTHVFNLGYGRGHSVLEVIESVKRVTDKDFPVECIPRRQGDPVAVVADPGKARELLSLAVPAPGILDRIIRDHRNWMYPEHAK